MTWVYLALGSNLGDRAAQLTAAQAALAALPGTRRVRMSRVYETEPVGPQDQGRFLNAAAELVTELGPRLLLQHTQRIERDAGRLSGDQRVPWGPRELDLDLLLFGDQRLHQPGLIVPHPQLHRRWFVLKPLADLIPDHRPPGLAQSIQQMLDALEHEQPLNGKTPADTTVPPEQSSY
jgi:2-amino-4-hydroxy-6-hydroxymethyldihydropteridine diphosphokinase